MLKTVRVFTIATVSGSTAGLHVGGVPRLPKKIKNSKDYVDALLKDKKIFIAPGSIFGSNGEGYIRISLCVSKDDIVRAIKRFEL